MKATEVIAIDTRFGVAVTWENQSDLWLWVEFSGMWRKARWLDHHYPWDGDCLRLAYECIAEHIEECEREAKRHLDRGHHLGLRLV